MYREIKTTVVPLTLKLVKEFAEDPGWPGERDLKPERVWDLREQFNRGLFYGPVWYVAWLNRHRIRINGKHSSWMLNELDVLPELNVIIREFKCDDEDDLRLLFRSIDSQRSVRNPVDLVNMQTSIHPQLRGAPLHKPSVVRLASGVVLFSNRGQMCRTSVEDRLKSINEDPDFFLAADNYGVKPFMKVGATAALYATWRASRASAPPQQHWRLFWDAVVDGNAPNEDPTRLLSELLKHGRGETSRCVLAKAIHAWNAYTMGVTLKRLTYFEDKDVPEARTPAAVGSPRSRVRTGTTSSTNAAPTSPAPAPAP